MKITIDFKKRVIEFNKYMSDRFLPRYERIDISDVAENDRRCPICNKNLIPYRKIDNTHFYIGVCFSDKIGGVLRHKKNENKRTGNQFLNWALTIKSMFNHRCFNCGSSENLNAHHIIPVAMNRNLALDIHNGICLCENCHKTLHEVLPIGNRI